MKLENYTMSDIFDYLVSKTAIDKGVSKTIAKKLILNALSFNIVVAEIAQMADYLLENATEEAPR